MKDITQIAKKLDGVNYQLSKMGIFKYDTADESDPSKERIRSDITVEIGGPSTHIKFTVMTRKEHTMIKDIVQTIFNDRKKKVEEELSEFCRERLVG